MMNNSNKRKIVNLNEEEELYKKGLITIIDGIFGKLEKELPSEKDPFERYLKQVHLRLFKELKNYTDRAILGRIAIINELDKENFKKNSIILKKRDT